MKLPDFTEDPAFKKLVSDMGAKPIKWRLDSNWKPIDPEFEIEIPISEVIERDDYTLNYNGNTVILYIRDQNYNPFYGDSKSQYKFHIAMCQQLQTFKKQEKYDKYVVTNKRNNKFLIKYIYQNKVHKDVEEELHICKHCLDILKWKGYHKKMPNNQKDITVGEFSIEEFFEEYGYSLIAEKPKYTAENAPPNEYNDDWPEVSRRQREQVLWKCEECGNSFYKVSYRRFLDTHHKNTLKYDDRPENLKVLCIKCHLEEPNHGHLSKSPKYKDYLQEYNSS